ncbi:MAG: M6 family metalloprotease domain-containing protein, partial [Prevotella sp.]|nr:M6 family metalloprotease domain-containing protein [Prevotella sp.]
MRHATLTVFISLLFATLWAVPARRIVFTHTQKDGTELRLMLVGDENLHYYKNMDTGERMEHTANGDYCVISPKDFEQREAKANTQRQLINKKDIQRQSVQSRSRMQGTSKQKMKGRNVKAMVGEKNALVIMVEFPNQKFTHSRQEFADMLNEPGYSKNGHIGSAKDYFAAQSYGKLSLNFTVVGPYMVSRESTYYGKDDNGVHDVKAHEMVREAIKLAKNDVDYKLFDWDGDGEVDNVMVIYAGYGGNAKSEEPDYLWPQRHYFSLNGGIEQISNLMFDSYCYVNEITETKDGDLMSGIGTACHEFSHTLGLSDVYYEERKDTP